MRERKGESDSQEIERGTQKEIMRERQKGKRMMAREREDEMRGSMGFSDTCDCERKNKCNRKGDECASD